jgi:hypothetical protein
MICASNRTRLAATLVAMATGCGAGGHASSSADGGDGGAAEAPADTSDAPRTPVTGRHSFDVVGSIRPDPLKPPAQPQAGAMLPSTDTFTLTLDADAPRFIVGSGGSSQVVPATTSDGVTFRAAKPVGISRIGGGCAQGTTSLDYDSFEVTVTGSSLRGTGAGWSNFVSGDVASLLPFVADLTGGPDETAPFLIDVFGMVTSPFEGIQIFPSEPLPATATARLVSSDGSRVDLLPVLTKDDLPVISSFNKPDVVLHAGGGYSVTFDGLVDFAGHSGSASASLRIGTVSTPPLVPEDGFESATGAVVGGAPVVRDGSSLAPIAGAASAYIETAGAPTPPGATFGSRLFVRLARQPSDTKLRFSYREVGSTLPLGFNGSVDVGSVDGPFAGTRTFAQTMTATQVMVVPGAFVSVSDTQLMEVALPDATANDLIVSIEGVTFSCGFGPPGTGLLIDDLRVE